MIATKWNESGSRYKRADGSFTWAGRRVHELFRERKATYILETVLISEDQPVEHRLLKPDGEITVIEVPEHKGERGVLSEYGTPRYSNQYHLWYTTR